MKCIPLLTILVALSIVPVTSAQTEKQRAKKNAAIAKFAHRAANQPRAVARTQNARPHFNRGTAGSVHGSRGRSVIAHPRTFQPRRTVTSGGSAVFTPRQTRVRSGSGNRRGGNGTVTTRPRNWRNNRTNANANNNAAASRNRRNSGGTNARRNRNGNQQGHWNRHRGGNRRNWDRRHRGRSWWRSHYTRFALFGGGYYYWNAGYWYPAYGYDPYFSTYVYDAPIYGYNDLEPQQVIASVQAALQRRGYDPGGVDGDFGPLTRRALLDYQQDNGLEATGEIDEATLNALGLE